MSPRMASEGACGPSMQARQRRMRLLAGLASVQASTVLHTARSCLRFSSEAELEERLSGAARTQPKQRTPRSPFPEQPFPDGRPRIPERNTQDADPLNEDRASLVRRDLDDPQQLGRNCFEKPCHALAEDAHVVVAIIAEDVSATVHRENGWHNEHEPRCAGGWPRRAPRIRAPVAGQ